MFSALPDGSGAVPGMMVCSERGDSTCPRRRSHAAGLVEPRSCRAPAAGAATISVYGRERADDCACARVWIGRTRVGPAGRRTGRSLPGDRSRSSLSRRGGGVTRMTGAFTRRPSRTAAQRLRQWVPRPVATRQRAGLAEPASEARGPRAARGKVRRRSRPARRPAQSSQRPSGLPERKQSRPRPRPRPRIRGRRSRLVSSPAKRHKE